MKKIILSIFTLTMLFFAVTDAQEAKAIPSDTVSKKMMPVEKKKEMPADSTKMKKEKTSAKKDEKKGKQLSFSKDIFPIIKTTCLPCHKEEDMGPSELYFDSYETMMKGGKHGAPIIAGKGDSSIIVKKLRPNPPFGDQMPDSKKIPKLTDEQIKLFIDWINQGAKKN
ncbi:MAG: c-type cytochrome domain-containing protein [Bacteroidota bacterium]